MAVKRAAAKAKKGKKSAVKGGKKGFNPVLHPFLFAAYPAIFLYAHNINEITVGYAWGPLTVSVLGAAALFGCLWFFLKDAFKAGIITSVATLAFLTYGHAYSGAQETLSFIEQPELKHALLLAAYAVISYFLADWLIKTEKLAEINMIMNTMAAVLVGMVIYQSAAGVARHYAVQYKELSKKILPDVQKARAENKGKGLPDIYFIVLDGHAREDVMKEMYGYDMSGFTSFLESKGFYVAKKASANYCQTFLSLAATFNMRYLDDLSGKSVDGERARVMLGEMIRHNPAVDTLRANGYQHVSYFSGFVGTELNRICDLYLPAEGLAAEELSEFDSVFFNTTIISGFAGVANLALKKKIGPHMAYVRRSQYILENIHLSAKLTSPKFVFAHIILPHPPFVFDENGPTDRYVGTPGVEFHDGSQSAFPKDKYIKAYAAQAKYLHKKAKEMVERLLEGTGGKAVIILQADHGPGSQWDTDSLEKTNLKERFSIFSAYYLPGDGKKLLYENITPVNDFRLILSHYLGLKYDLLPDESFYSTWDEPFKFTRIERQ